MLQNGDVVAQGAVRFTSKGSTAALEAEGTEQRASGEEEEETPPGPLFITACGNCALLRGYQGDAGSCAGERAFAEVAAARSATSWAT